MRNQTNYHSHTQFCDGRAQMEDFVLAAIREKFTSYGFSAHAPLPFPTKWTMKKEDVPAYIEEFQRLKGIYKNDIELYIGLEADYIDEQTNPASDFIQGLPLDYRIGSVHLLPDRDGVSRNIDCDPETFKTRVKDFFDADLKNLVLLYFKQMMRMIERGGFNFVGHPDKISFNASYMQPDIKQQAWYKKAVTDYFEFIASKGMMVEVNTKHYQKYNFFYPNIEHFTLLHELHIPVLVNSDAHYPEKINESRHIALNALHHAGIRTVIEIEKGKWIEKEISIDSF